MKSPLHVAVPSDVDLDDVLADISTDGVSAPADDVAGLTAVVTDARERGVDLSVVVVDANPGPAVRSSRPGHDGRQNRRRNGSRSEP
ncbi:DUF6676 family protein [Rhodococcus sp. 3Y1]